MAAVAAFTVIVAAWPGFGAKVGGTIAMLPGFLVLYPGREGQGKRGEGQRGEGQRGEGQRGEGQPGRGNGDKSNRGRANRHKANLTEGNRTEGNRFEGRYRTEGKWLSWSRAALIGVSGLALVTLFALVNYFVPVTGHSDIGGFIGQLLHGGADATVRRKIGSNLGSLTANPFNLVIPVVLVGLGRHRRLARTAAVPLLARAYRQIPLLKAALAAVWLTAVLGWLAEDSGITVPAAALPFVLPLIVVILSSLPAGDQKQATAGQPAPQGQLASVSSQGQATAGVTGCLG